MAPQTTATQASAPATGNDELRTRLIEQRDRGRAGIAERNAERLIIMENADGKLRQMRTAEYENLAVAVVGLAIKEEGSDYLLDPCATWWLELVGVDPERAWVRAMRASRRGGSDESQPDCPAKPLAWGNPPPDATPRAA